MYIDKNIIKNCEKLPNKIKNSLEKGKKIGNEWKNENKLCSLINDCINIENNINDIKIIDKSIKNCNNLIYLNLNFSPEENKEIKNFWE